MSASHRPGSHQTEREDANSSIFKKKKLLTDTIKQKKHELTQEFKESYREKNIKVAENVENISKPNEHKLRHALDNLLAENNTRNNRLNELQLRLDIMRRDDLSGAEINEKSIEETYERSIELDSGKTQKENDTGANNNFKEGKELIEKYVAVKKTLENVMKKRIEEQEIQKALEAKITGLVKSQKVMTDRIGKRGALYNMMQKRFINLGKTEFAAKNKLTRSNNKLLSVKKEVEKQRAHEDDYFHQKRTALQRNKLVVEDFKDTIAKNLLYLEKVKHRKEEVDEKLEEVDYEEKQIVTKRQASEYILLYIDLLESLEREYVNPSLPTSPPRSTRALKDKSKSVAPVKKGDIQHKGPKMIQKRSFSKDFDQQSFSDTNKDRDIVITRIAQFYDQHPDGINALISALMKIFSEMQLKEQSLGNTHHDINAQRLKKHNEVKRLESLLSKFQHGFILLEDIEEEVEESSPEHVREAEKKVAGKLSKYDIKTVKLGEYLVNLCSAGIRDALLKLTNASCSLAGRCGRRIPVEILSLAKEIEGFLSEPKSDYNSLELQDSRRSLIKPMPGTENNSAKENADAQSKNRCVTDSSESKDLNTDRTKEPSSRGDELSKVSHSLLSVNEEFTKFEQMFKNCFNKAKPEMIYKWNERIFEAKWIFEYMNKSDVHRILEKYIHYYGNDITETMMKSIFQDLRNEARHAQKKRTTETFSFMEDLILLYIKHYELRKSELSEEYIMEIKSEILDDSNQGLGVSEHVEKAHETRCQQLFMDSIIEDLVLRRRTDDKQPTESDIDMVLFRKKDTQGPKAVKTTREAISDLHSRYQRERKGLATSFGQRSNSMPKLKMRIKKKAESQDVIPSEETIEKGHKGKENVNRTEDRKHLAESALLVSKNSSVGAHRNSIGHIKVNEDALEEKETTRKNMINKAEVTTGTKDKKQTYFVPSSFYRAQKKSKDIEEFMKKIAKDGEVLRKITLLEKRQTEFDKKSKDYDRRRDYVPNFSLLHKYDLNREKRNDQTMQEWWRRQEGGMLDLSERGRSTTSLFMQTDRKGERSPMPDQYTDSTINVLYSQNKKSASRIAVKPWVLPEEGVSQTARPDRTVVRVSKKKREGSLEDMENKLYISALAQNSTILESSDYKY